VDNREAANFNAQSIRLFLELDRLQFVISLKARMKPVIFFSHSSRDRDVILPIRNRLLEGTGNAIDVFMSSDGASIPFGRNWLKEIEDALTDCKLMFVWMTPTSMASSWIPFESGHAYARGIRVVPIGFLGTTLGSLPAPINMLQGFDVTSGSGLNNIIGVINDQFALTFPNLFDADFYTANIEDNSPENNPGILRYVKSIKCNFTTVSSNGDAHGIRSDWLGIFKRILEKHEIPFTVDGGQLYGAGFRVDSTSDRDGKIDVNARIDPLALNTTWKLWTDALKQIYDGDLPYAFMVPTLTDDCELPDDDALVGSRLLNSDVSFDTQVAHVIYRYRNIDFRMLIQSRRSETQKELVLLIPGDNDLPIPLYSLMKLFEERRVIEIAR
jgi:hypothetical protein